MKHASTRAVFAYWNERRGHRPAPERDDIDPGAIRQALGDTFMLAADFVDQLRFRLAGTRICALFGRELKGEIFTTLCSDDQPQDREDAVVRRRPRKASGVVAGLTGHADDGATIDLEMLLLPLAHIGHARIRVLGVLAPLAPPYWLGAKPVVHARTRARAPSRRRRTAAHALCGRRLTVGRCGTASPSTAAACEAPSRRARRLTGR